MVVIKEAKSTNVGLAVAAADIGDSAAHSDLAISVGGEGEPTAIWIKAIYGISITAGTLILYHSAAPDTTARSTSNIDLAVYLSLTGDGITEMNIGPIEENVYLSSDATLVSSANRITIDYEQV